MKQAVGNEHASSGKHRILISGGGGFVGHWLVQTLRDDYQLRDEVFALGRNQEAVHTQELGLEALDITDREQVERVVAAVRPTAVVHLAAISAVHEAQRAPWRSWEVNLIGTYNLAEAVVRHVPEATFIYASTSEVYGSSFNTNPTPLSENALLDPGNPYAASKAAADLLIGQMARDGLRAIRFRPFNHTGPGQTDRFVVPAFASQIVRIERRLQEAVIRVGNLDAVRDFLDVRDVAAAYATAIFHASDLQPGCIFNLASGVPRRIGDILDQLIALAQVQVDIAVDPKRMRPSDTPVAVGNASRARLSLGWESRIPWTTTLQEVLAYWRSRAEVNS